MAKPDTGNARGSERSPAERELREPVRAASSRDRIAALSCALIAAVSLGLAAFYPLNNADTFGHLAQGREIVELGHVPQDDLVALGPAAGRPFHNYEWLSDVLFYRAYSALGPNALLACVCSCMALAGALLVLFAWRVAGPRAAMLAALLIVLAIPASRFRFSVRPHVLALPLCALYLHGLSALVGAPCAPDSKRALRWAAFLGVAHVFWVNAHGSHLLGVVITLCFLAGNELQRSPADTPGARGRARGRLVAVLGLELVASAVSPYGPAIVLDAIEHVFNPAYRALITEWSPWSPEHPLWWLLAPVVQGLLLVACGPRLWRTPRVGAALALVAAVLSVAAFRSIRFVAEMLLVTSAIVAVPLAARLADVSWTMLARGLVAAWVAAALIVPYAAARLPPLLPLGGGIDTTMLPAAIGAWLGQHHPHPHLLAEADDAWYLRFAAPKARVVIDGRIPFYGPGLVARLPRAWADPGQLAALLSEYDVDAVVLKLGYQAHAVATGWLAAQPSWRLAMEEDNHVLFVHERVRTPSGEAIADLALPIGYGEVESILLADDARQASLRAALAALPEHPNTRGYKGWIEGLLAIRPFLQAGPHDGLRAPTDAGERAALQKARAGLARAAASAQSVPIVHAYLALAQIALCEIEPAETSLALANREGPSRHTLLGSMELAIARGQGAQVAEFLGQAASAPEAANDAWLESLRAKLRAPPPCPEPE